MPTLEKLDIILMSRDWEARVPTVQLYKFPRLVSDHNPLILSTYQSSKERKRDFRFETS
jgi:endonuclease/exonuclease/phosphatase family metal-dependent hydrolase